MCQVAQGIKMMDQDMKMAKRSKIHRFVLVENMKLNLAEKKLHAVTADIKIPDTIL